MPCLWSTKTTIFKQFSGGIRTLSALKGVTGAPRSSWRSAPCSFHAFRATPVSNFHWSLPSSALSPEISSPPPSSSKADAPPSTFPDQLSEAQLSRAVGAAIRLSVQRADYWDAFHLWHSTRWSVAHYNSLPFQNPFSKFQPINFGRAVSPRYASHCLIHALLRAGLRKHAAPLAQQMMKDGTLLHTKSFEALLHSFHPDTIIPGEDRTMFNRLKHPHPKKSALNVRMALPEDPLTSLAVQLLRDAHKHRWQRTHSMYETALSACLIQGEILVASLLLALLIKDYQLRCSRRHVSSKESPDACIQPASRSSHEADQRSMSALVKATKASLSNIEDFIRPHIERGQSDPLFEECSQSLAILAGLLETQSLPTSRIASLVKLLYMYPRCDVQVLVRLPSGEWQSCGAYWCFNKVLGRLIHTLPTARTLHSSERLPPLDRASYHTLLHYALIERRSVDTANRVLSHMLNERQPPLQPGPVVYNILLRGSTLLRRNELASDVIATLRKVASSIDPINEPLRSTEEPPILSNAFENVDNAETHATSTLKRTYPPYLTRVSRLVKQAKEGALAVPTPSKSVPTNSRMLVSYIKHIVSAGTPEACADVLFRMLPELATVNHPDWGNMGEDRRRMHISRNRNTAMVRAVALGPQFFAVVINALRKAGRTGLAERVWMLAKEAEAASWNTVTPWCLPIEAYTAMLQCYGTEARKGLLIHYPIPLQDGSLHYEGRSSVPTKAYALGWGRFMANQEAWAHSQDRRRHVLGRRMGLLLYRSMQIGGQSIYGSLVKMQDEHIFKKMSVKPPEVPVPDARFFNAALDLFSRRPNMIARRVHPSRTRWQQRLRRANERFITLGYTSPQWTPELEEVARDMLDCGYPIPAGFRPALVGKIQGFMGQEEGPEVNGRRPYAFPAVPRRPRFRPHAIATAKSKGTPVQRG
ncbi:hypothetical protein OF83DRAFT_1117862 [Amylostereum chailletii]|nr:hypothetical protein OF83DRAFT_1117862 [Amylostereum chailletii]